MAKGDLARWPPSSASTASARAGSSTKASRRGWRIDAGSARRRMSGLAAADLAGLRLRLGRAVLETAPDDDGRGDEKHREGKDTNDVDHGTCLCVCADMRLWHANVNGSCLTCGEMPISRGRRKPRRLDAGPALPPSRRRQLPPSPRQDRGSCSGRHRPHRGRAVLPGASIPATASARRRSLRHRSIRTSDGTRMRARAPAGRPASRGGPSFLIVKGHPA